MTGIGPFPLIIVDLIGVKYGITEKIVIATSKKYPLYPSGYQ